MGAEKSIAVMTISSFLGLFLAVLVGVMYENGIIIDEMVSGSITLADLMFAAFFIPFIFGMLLGF